MKKSALLILVFLFSAAFAAAPGTVTPQPVAVDAISAPAQTTATQKVECVNAVLTEEFQEKCKNLGMSVNKIVKDSCVSGFECAKIEPTVSSSGGGASYPAKCAEQNYDEIKKKCYENGMEITKTLGSDGCAFLFCAAKVAPIAKAVTASVPVVAEESCITDSMSAELNDLLVKLKDASNDAELQKAIKEKITQLNRQISEKKNNCMMQNKIETATASQAVPASPMQAISDCNNYDALKQKKEYIAQIIGVPEKLKEYGLTANDAKNKVNEIAKLMEEAKIKCSEQSKTNLGAMVSEAVKSKEGGAKEIVAYYKSKMSEAISAEQQPSLQIQQLKSLRDEIDKMISDLVSRQDQINTEDIKEIVSEITVKPSEIVADNVRIQATNKVFSVGTGTKKAEIISSKSEVRISSEGVSASASEIKIEGEKLTVGDAEVKFLPGQIAKKINRAPKEISLAQDGKMAVYTVKTEEKRKLLGIFKMNVEKQFNLDAENGDIMSEKSPWWAFATTKDEAKASSSP